MFLKNWTKKTALAIILILVFTSPANAALFKKLIPGATINVEKHSSNVKVTWSIPEGEKERNVYVQVTVQCLDYKEGTPKTETLKKSVPWSLNGSTTVTVPQDYYNYDSVWVSRVELINNPPAPNFDQVIIKKDGPVHLVEPYAEFNVGYSNGQIAVTWSAEKISRLANRPDVPNMRLQIQRPGSGWEDATSNLSSGRYAMQVEPQDLTQVYGFRFVFRDSEVWGEAKSVTVPGRTEVVPVDDDERDNRNTAGGTGGGSLTSKDKGIPIFPADRQKVIMFWYKILAGLSGAFIFLVFIKSGYQYIVNPSPASKASLVETVQKSIIGILIISFAPMFVTILININDVFVDLCLDTYDALTSTASKEFHQEAQMGEEQWMDRFVAAPIGTIIEMATRLFGLAPLGEVIFNESPKGSILANGNLFLGDIKVGNVLGNVLVSLALIGFTVYYNAVYTIRRWVVTAVLGATPIIIWIWVLSGRRQVIDIWLSELIQTIFMQSFHALTFGIFFSILCFTGTPGSVNSQFAHMLIEVGKFLAAFGGVICFGIIVLQGLKIITTSEEKTRAEAVSNIKKALLGLIILGLAAMIASFLAQEPLTIYFPSVSGGETNITLWQLFFVLIAIVPVSKMFSTIFMSFLARIGTVDEDAWATKGLGIMGGIVTLGKAGKSALSNTPMSGGTDKPNTTGPGGDRVAGTPQTTVSTPDTASGARQVSSPSGTAGSYATASSTVREAKPDPYGYSPDSPDTYGLGPIDTHGPSAPETSEPPLEPADVYMPPPEVGRTSESETTPEGDVSEGPVIVPEAQQVKYQQAILNTRGTVEGATSVGQYLGKVAGFATPGADKALATFFGAGARIATAPVASAYAIYKLGRELPEGSRSLTNITGRETNLGAGVQTATTILLSPLGGKSVNLALKAGSAIDYFQNRHTPENT